MFVQAQEMVTEPGAGAVGASIVAGRAGSTEARGMLFERCRDYLLLVAERELDPGLRGKVGASDLVQQTLLDAERGFAAFRGQTENELRAWLHRILQNCANQVVRQYRTAAKRDVRFERSLSTWGDSAGDLPLVADTETPSRQIAAAEEVHRLLLALSHLPGHYQDVVRLRNIDRKPFEEIGALMGRSPEAVRKLWVRAIERLRIALEGSDDPRAAG